MNLGKWIGLFAFLAAVWILWRIRQALLLVFVAVILATALNRLVDRLQKAGLPRGTAVFLAVMALLLLGTGFIGLVIPPFVEQLQRFMGLLPELWQEAEQGIESLQRRLPWSQEFQVLDLLTQQAQSLIGRLLNHAFIWVSDLLAIALKLVLILVLTIMLLVAPLQYRQPFIRLFPAFYRSRVDMILQRCEVGIVGWVIGTLLTMMFVFILSGLGLWSLQLPLGLACALWAGSSELVPNIGYIVGMLPPLAIALVEAPWKAPLVIGLFFLIQQLESYIVVPWVMKEQVALPPAVTLLSQVVFTAFFGVLGLFLAIPLMVITKIWLEELLIHDLMDQWQ